MYDHITDREREAMDNTTPKPEALDFEATFASYQPRQSQDEDSVAISSSDQDASLLADSIMSTTSRITQAPSSTRPFALPDGEGFPLGPWGTDGTPLQPPHSKTQPELIMAQSRRSQAWRGTGTTLQGLDRPAFGTSQFFEHLPSAGFTNVSLTSSTPAEGQIMSPAQISSTHGPSDWFLRSSDSASPHSDAWRLQAQALGEELFGDSKIFQDLDPNSDVPSSSDVADAVALSTSSTNSTPSKGLLDLPPELRNYIYELSYIAPPSAQLQTNLYDAVAPVSKELLLASSQVHNEAIYFYRSAYRSYWLNTLFIVDAHNNDISQSDFRSIEKLQYDDIQHVRNLELRTSEFDTFVLLDARGLWKKTITSNQPSGITSTREEWVVPFGPYYEILVEVWEEEELAQGECTDRYFQVLPVSDQIRSLC